MSDTYQIQIRIANTAVSGAIPHAFVTISGPGLTNPVTVGYYPVVTGLSGLGTVRNDAASHEVGTTADGQVLYGAHPYDRSVTFDISGQQAMNALQFVAKVANDPGMYQLLGASDKSNIIMADGYQCTGFARDVVRAAGIEGLKLYPTLASSYPGMLGPEFSFLEANQVQAFRGTPTIADFGQTVRDVYSGIKRTLGAADHTPDSVVPAASDGTTALDSNVSDPAGLGTTARNSSSYITNNGEGNHSATISAGGTLSDLWVLQKNSTTGFANAQDFYAAVLACNPNITNVNRIQAGQNIYLPEKLSNGNIVYNYAGGISLTTNPASGEFKLIVPNDQGGKNTTERIADENALGGESYTVRQSSNNATGIVTRITESREDGLTGDIKPVSIIDKTDTNGDSKTDRIQIAIDTNLDGLADQLIDTGTTQSSMLNADKQVQSLYNMGQLGSGTWSDYIDWSTSLLVNNSLTMCTPSNSDIYSPIGAFYESRSAGNDPALSIANKTFRVLSNAGTAVTSAQLAALDTNVDGKVSGTELNGLTAWVDANEDGINQGASELTALSTAMANAGLSSIRSSDYTFYTAGNANFRTAAQGSALAPVTTRLAPTALASNYATLRATDNRFWINAYQWIDWSAGQVKLSSNQQNMVGTEGNDNFDIGYYAAYNGVYFNLNLVQNFYAGGGNDVMGGSTRSDKLWGGTGSDVLFGYAGDDKLYGEDGNDELQGGIGNDVLDGGIGVDKLFGQVGNDTLVGGDGNDIMTGFTASNDTKQTLAWGETDDDTLFGGSGADQMYGGLGNDYLDGGADNDLVIGGDGNDTLIGAAGDDEINGGTGSDVMDGGIGADKMFGGVGNDQMWGGDGNDIMMGFTPSNELKQTLAVGETDDDVMYGGAGDDLMLGGLGNDQIWGGIGNDEVQGGVGADVLYAEAGNDKLFGQVGNDVLYGGDGDDVLVGFTASNDLKQTLAAGETDDDFLYGGAGRDTLLGGLGNDYLDGGAGADAMEGGKGNDIYIVNSVNDVILEQQDEGYDSVVSSANYILNANIEELRLVEGYNINGTGNRLNNKIIGNSQDNILDGVTGADTMIGGLGNDTYYVDNLGDQAIELVGEGSDTVNASISYALGANVENLTLLDFSKAEKGMADGVNILVYGYPKAFELDYMQGNAVAGYKGTCALTSIANLATQANQALSEAQVVQTAINNNWCVTNASTTDYQRGGSNYVQQQALLNTYGIKNGIIMGYNEQAIANLIKGGRGVIIGLNAGKLWGDSAYLDNGGVNHVVTVTGVACDATTGAINGFYIADSGRGLVSDMTRYVAIADFRANASVTNAYAIYTIEPIKLWEENINATGNDLTNLINGNRGNNTLTGGKGNDTLIGGAGNDTYMFAKGDGQDTVIDTDATAGNTDALQLSGINQTNLWFKHMGNDLQINVMGTTDQILVKDWYVSGPSGTDNQVERIKTADGLTMYNTDVEKFVQAMAAFAPPPAAQTSWFNGQTSNGQVLLAVTH